MINFTEDLKNKKEHLGQVVENIDREFAQKQRELKQLESYYIQASAQIELLDELINSYDEANAENTPEEAAMGVGTDYVNEGVIE